MSCSTWPANTLKALPFFSTLNDAELTWLLPSVRRRSFKAKITVLHAGEPPDGLSILVSGKARLVHQDNEGHTLIAEVFGPGEVFGEMGLIDGTACPASVVAVDDIETAFIPRESLLECLGTSRAAAVHLLRTSLERLCKAHEQMANLALTKVYTRVAKVLAEHGPPCQSDARSVECFGTKRSQVRILSARLDLRRRVHKNSAQERRNPS